MHEPPKSKCATEGCETPAHARGICSKHYQRKRIAGTLGEKRINNPERSFREKTKADGECVVWAGASTDTGYGIITVGGKNVRAHRYAWERVNGKIPEGMMIDHICHNRACVRVEHLRLATPSQNAMYRSGTHSKTGVRNVYETPSGLFAVDLRKGGRTIHVGYFTSLEDAAAAAKKKREELFGEFGEFPAGLNWGMHNEQTA